MVGCNLVATLMEEGVQLFINMDFDYVKYIEYESFIDNLIYYTIAQLDLSFAISCLIKFVSAPQEAHMSTTKRIFSLTKITLENSFIIN
jgi:hypothetical protein